MFHQQLQKVIGEPADNFCDFSPVWGRDASQGDLGNEKNHCPKPQQTLWHAACDACFDDQRMGLKTRAQALPDFHAIIAEVLAMEREEAERTGDEVDSLPQEAASEQEVAAAEAAWGQAFPADYRAFLKICNGWDHVYYGIMLVGTEELSDAESYEDMRECLVDIFDEKTEGCEVTEEHHKALVIGWSENDAALILLVESGEIVEWLYEENSRHADLASYLVERKVYLSETRTSALAAIARTKAEWDEDKRASDNQNLFDELSQLPASPARGSCEAIADVPPAVHVADLIVRESDENKSIVAEVGLGLTLYLGASPSKDEVLETFRAFRKHFPVARELQWKEATLHGFSINTSDDPDAEPFADVMHIDDYGYHGLRVSIGSSKKATDLYYLNVRGIPAEYVQNEEGVNEELPRASFVELFVPHTESTEALYAFAVDMVSLLPVRSGHGGFAARVDDDRSDAKPWDSVFRWSRRFFGIDPVYVDGWLLAARQRMRGVGWLTVVGSPFLQVLDNSSSLEQLPASIMRSDGKHGAVFRAGSGPGLADVARGKFPDDLSELASRLQHLCVSSLLQQGNISMGGVWFSTLTSELPGAFSEHHATQAYLQKLTDPQSFIGPSARERASELATALVSEMDTKSRERWQANNDISEQAGFREVLRGLFNASYLCKNEELSTTALEHAATYYEWAPKGVYNNLLNSYVKLGRIGDGLKLLPVALQAAKEECWIYHGAACLLVLVGRLDEAMELVRCAKQADYPHFAKMQDDPDLALLASREEFQALFKNSSRI